MIKLDENLCPKCGLSDINWGSVTWMYEGRELGLDTDYKYPSRCYLNYVGKCGCGITFVSKYSLHFDGFQINDRLLVGKKSNQLSLFE